jgi:hypothetical protein
MFSWTPCSSVDHQPTNIPSCTLKNNGELKNRELKNGQLKNRRPKDRNLKTEILEPA